MTVSFTAGFWLIPIIAMWVWLALNYICDRLTSEDVVDFSGTFLIITAHMPKETP